MKLRRPLPRIRPRAWIVIAIVVVVAGGIVYWFGFGLPAQSAEAQSARATTRTVAASLETLEQSVESTGTLTPSVNEDVSFAVSGTVTAVKVDAGDTVKKGDVLAKVDTLSLDADLLQAKASLASAREQLASAEDADDGTDAAEAQVEAAEASVSVAKSSVSDAKDAVADATLKAPAAGLVTAVGIEVGDAVGSSSSSSSASSSSTDSSTAAGGTTTTATTSDAAFTIVGTDAWGVELTVSESDYALIAEGNQVEMTLDDDTVVNGTVDEIGVLPSASTGVALYPVEVSVTGSAEGLYDGVAVTANIVYERRVDVLTVPSAAVTTEGETSTVTVLAADGTQSDVEVTIGETVGDLVEIVDGIAEGDEVVVAIFTGGGGNSDDTGQLPVPGDFPSGGDFPAGGGDFPAGGQVPGGTTGG